MVTGEAHADAVKHQLPDLSQSNLLAEPSPRESMAAIALAAAVIQKRHGTRIMGSFPADHVIRDPLEFRAAVHTAVAAARTGKVVVIGIEPTGASSAFGYIQDGEPLEGVPGAFTARQFTEKPDLETAATMLAQGGFSWNAGMYVVATDVLLGHLERLQPTLFEGVTDIAAAWDTSKRDEVVSDVWPTLTRIAIDHAIAEPLAPQGGVAVVPGAFDWHDIGDFDSLASLALPDADGVVRIGRQARVVTVGASGATVVGGNKPVAIVGLDNVVVVESDDALLVVRRSAAQQVKDVRERLENS